MTLKVKFWHFLTPPHNTNSQNSIISFGYVDSQAKIFPILYLPVDNSTTRIAIVLLRGILIFRQNVFPFWDSNFLYDKIIPINNGKITCCRRAVFEIILLSGSRNQLRNYESWVFFLRNLLFYLLGSICI